MEILFQLSNLLLLKLYLNSLSNDNCLKDSSISLLSDHGLIIQSIFYILEFYKIENELPIVICYN